jgi:hypothetical protein
MHFKKQTKMRLIEEILQIIISYLGPLDFNYFFEQYNISFDFKFKYDMSYYCIDIINKNNMWSFMDEQTLYDNNINYYYYKQFILNKFTNMIITGIQLKFYVETTFDLNFLTNIGLHNFNNIKHLELSSTNIVHHIPIFASNILNVSILENFNSLETLNIKNFKLKCESNIFKINCSYMHTLKIINCIKITSFTIIVMGDYSKLRHVVWEEEFLNIFPFEKCTNLLTNFKELCIDNNNFDFNCLENCITLETLDITYSDIKNNNFLNACTNVKLLRLKHCNKLEYLNISSLNKCTKIIISNCKNIKYIYTNKTLHNLEYISIFSCNKLEKINGLQKCMNLENINLNYNFMLTYIDDLRNCEKLKYVCVHGPYIKNIGFLKLYKKNNFILNMIISCYSPNSPNSPNSQNNINRYYYNYNLLSYYAKSYILKNKCNIHHGIIPFFYKFMIEL